MDALADMAIQLLDFRVTRRDADEHIVDQVEAFDTRFGVVPPTTRSGDIIRPASDDDDNTSDSDYSDSEDDVNYDGKGCLTASVAKRMPNGADDVEMQETTRNDEERKDRRERRMKSLDELIAFFLKFDPVNACGEFDAWKTACHVYPTRDETLQAFRFMSDDLLATREDEKLLLCTRQRDHEVHAIYSFMLQWSDEGLNDFGRRHVEYIPFVAGIVDARRLNTDVYRTDDGVPFVRCAFKLLTRYVQRSRPTSSTRALGTFQLPADPRMVVHFRQVYEMLRSDAVTSEMCASLQAPMRSPYAGELGGVGDDGDNVVKVITGQACCGKTTLLRMLKNDGWSVCSRGDLGTFAGKASSPAAIAGLHAAMEFVLRRGDVLGDRGPIDNPLWSIIMPLCDPKYEDHVVTHLLDFFGGTTNEYVAGYMCRQRVVVFVDPYPEENRRRMLERCINGDAFRARIKMYPIVQFMAYYMAARLYGWTVRCVPYDDQRKFQPHMYGALAVELRTLFGSPRRHDDEPLPAASRPEGLYLRDERYSRATGIFK